MESKNFCNDKFIEEYNSFLKQLEPISEDIQSKEIINTLKEECETDKLTRGMVFYNTLKDDSIFELFCKSKIKIFSSKDKETSLLSNSLFGEQLPLKKLINNQDQKTKDIIWKYLHLFYFLLESNNKNRSTRKSKISKILKENNSSTKENLTDDVKNELLDVDVNDDTNNMIDDIVKSFEKTLSGNSANPFESIMEITQKITEKYNDKIESGDIELDKLMDSIQKSIPGMPNLMGEGGEGGMAGLGAMFGGQKKPVEKVIIDDSFSTDNVELGDKDKKEGSGMNLTNMLNMMNSMNKGAGEGGGDSGMPNMGGIFSMLGKLDNINNEEDAEKLKEEMDSYLEKELGVDVSKLNQQLSDAQEKITDKVNDDVIEYTNDNIK
jgi:hypothetical protein|uniref:Uncharacterized protein n=1 Tax=viral metagenome TaxID=1070528 RepID=A0A6C0IXR5_9ZZZZ